MLWEIFEAARGAREGKMYTAKFRHDGRMPMHVGWPESPFLKVPADRRKIIYGEAGKTFDNSGNYYVHVTVHTFQQRFTGRTTHDVRPWKPMLDKPTTQLTKEQAIERLHDVEDMLKNEGWDAAPLEQLKGPYARFRHYAQFAAAPSLVLAH